MTKEDLDAVLLNSLLETFAWRCAQLTPGEPISDAYDLLDQGPDGDPILDGLRKALWALPNFNQDIASDMLADISSDIHA